MACLTEGQTPFAVVNEARHACAEHHPILSSFRAFRVIRGPSNLLHFKGIRLHLMPFGVCPPIHSGSVPLSTVPLSILSRPDPGQELTF